MSEQQPYSLQDLLAELQSSGIVVNYPGYKKEPLPQLLASHDIHGIVKYIKSDKCKKISILAGAGISVSAGIPDFRSKGGFYNTLDLSKYPLTSSQSAKCAENSEYILTYELFKVNPAVYITARREMILAPTKYNATISHWFLRLLSDKGLLKRYYSTNIDGLDFQIGLPEDKICNVHGTLAKALCIECNEFVDMDWFRNLVQQEKYPIICPKDNCNGYVKPDTVLFGQSLPRRYHDLVATENDLDDVDLFIVIGTSLAVAPSNYLPQKVDLQQCVRLLVNRDSVEQRFEFDVDTSNDIWLKGNCDDSLRELVRLLGWKNDLYNLLPQQLKDKEKTLFLDPEEKKEQKMDIDTNKERLIQSLLGGSTSFLTKSQINRVWTSSFSGTTHRTLILPVIFVQDPSKNLFDTIWKSVNHNIQLVLKYNFDGIILTNHGFMCKDLIFIIEKVRSEYPKLWIGVNFVGCITDELQYLIKKQLLQIVNGLWMQNCGISFALGSDQIIRHCKASDRLVKYREIEAKWMTGTGVIFGGIEYDNNTANGADYDRLCKKLAKFAAKGFVHCVCTSLIGAHYHKIESFKKGVGDNCKLAVSHGVTVDNVDLYLGIADAIFLDKGLSDDNLYTFNEFKMSKFRNCVQKYYQRQPVNAAVEQKNDTILSPVMEEADNKNKFKFDEEILYQLYVHNADDINEDLNGIYKVIVDEHKLPSIQHKTESIFTPNFMYYLKSFKTAKEYGIFIIPSLQQMNIYKPTWVIAQIVAATQQPIYYYASKVDFKQQNAMKIPSECDDVHKRKWVIVGGDGTGDITMKLKVLTLKTFDERRRNFSAMFLAKNKAKMKSEIALDKKIFDVIDSKHDELKIFDVIDTKVSCVEMIGSGNMLRVTEDICELKREWIACELGVHDELEMFLGAIGKVIDIEEDDDTVKLEWCNYDFHWLPAKACWLTWKDRNRTAPKYIDEDSAVSDSNLLNSAFGGDIPQ